MKILLDENLPHRLRLSLTEHDVSTVRHVGWSGSKNGPLVDLAEGAGYELLVMGDQSLSYQQSLKGRRIAVITLSANELPAIPLHLPKIKDAIALAAPCSFQTVVVKQSVWCQHEKLPSLPPPTKCCLSTEPKRSPNKVMLLIRTAWRGLRHHLASIRDAVGVALPVSFSS